MIIKFFFIFLAYFYLIKIRKASINCNQYTEKIGKEYKIPNKLLTSISLVESGLKKGEKFCFMAMDIKRIWKIKVF